MSAVSYGIWSETPVIPYIWWELAGHLSFKQMLNRSTCSANVLLDFYHSLKKNVCKYLCSVYGPSGLFLIYLQCILVVFLLQGLIDSLEANRAMVCVNTCKFPQLNQVVSDNLCFLLWQFLLWYSYRTDILQIFIWGLCATLASTFFWTGPLFWDLSFYCQILVVFSRVCGLRLDVFISIVLWHPR